MVDAVSKLHRFANVTHEQRWKNPLLLLNPEERAEIFLAVQNRHQEITGLTPFNQGTCVHEFLSILNGCDNSCGSGICLFAEVNIKEAVSPGVPEAADGPGIYKREAVNVSVGHGDLLETVHRSFLLPSGKGLDQRCFAGEGMKSIS